MDRFGEFANVVVTLDLIAVGIACLVVFAGTVIAPIAIISLGTTLCFVEGCRLSGATTNRLSKVESRLIRSLFDRDHRKTKS